MENKMMCGRHYSLTKHPAGYPPGDSALRMFVPFPLVIFLKNKRYGLLPHQHQQRWPRDRGRGQRQQYQKQWIIFTLTPKLKNMLKTLELSRD